MKRLRAALLLIFVGSGIFGPSTIALTQQKITLRLSTWDSNEGQKALRETLKDFEKLNPNIKVKLEAPGYMIYCQKLLVQYAANVSPDVAIFHNSTFLKFAKRDGLYSLDSFIKSTPGLHLDKYYQEAIEHFKYNDQLYVLPRDVAPSCVIYYNKKLLDEAGIPYPDGSWTWDYQVRPWLKEKDFLWVIQKLTKLDKKKKPLQWGFNAYYLRLLADNFALSSGANYADDMKNMTKVTFDDPKVVKAYQLTADLANVHQWIPNDSQARGMLQSTRRDLWISQKTAMYFSGIWDVLNIRSRLQKGTSGWFDWDIAPFPAYKDGTKRYYSGSAGYGIFKTTKHPKEAWKLVQWLSGPPGMRKFAETGLAQPALIKMATSFPWVPTSKSKESFLPPYNKIITHHAVPYSWFEPDSMHWHSISLLINEYLSPIWNGTISAKAGLSIANKEAQRFLDTQLRKEKLPLLNWWVAGGIGLFCAIILVLWVFWPVKANHYSPRRKNESKIAYLFLAPWILGFLAFTFGPMIISLLMSVADWDMIQPAKWYGLQNYKEAFGEDPRFWISLGVTLIYVSIAIPLGLILSLGLASLLNLKVKGATFYRTCFYLPSLASIVAACLIWRKIFQAEGGLLNTLIYGSDGHGNFLGLANFLSQFTKPGEQIDWLGNEHTALASMILMSLWNVGAPTVVLLAGLQNIPKTYYEVAILDGANTWNRLMKVTLPLLSPSLWFCLVTGAIGSFQIFTKAYVMTDGGPGNATRFFMLHLYNQAFSYLRMGYASALAWILFLVILGFTLLKLKLNKFVYYEGEIR